LKGAGGGHRLQLRASSSATERKKNGPALLTFTPGEEFKKKGIERDCDHPCGEES